MIPGLRQVLNQCACSNSRSSDIHLEMRTVSLASLEPFVSMYVYLLGGVERASKFIPPDSFFRFPKEHTAEMCMCCSRIPQDKYHGKVW
jgi:hypothetical protein